MSLKRELQIWSDALDAYQAGDVNRCLELFGTLEPSSKIYYNMGTVCAELERYDEALERFEQAIKLDPFLAVAYYQAGICNFVVGRYDVAVKDLEDALVNLRANKVINYEQIGLKFRLASCEILFNRGLAKMHGGDFTDGLNDLRKAAMEKQDGSHKVIDQALNVHGQGFSVFQVPRGYLFRPSDIKLKNLETRDYLGQARVIAATSTADMSSDNIAKLNKRETQLPRVRPKRSNTSAARLEHTSSVGLAKPLTIRPSFDLSQVSEEPENKTPTRHVRSQTIGVLQNPATQLKPQLAPILTGQNLEAYQTSKSNQDEQAKSPSVYDGAEFIEDFVRTDESAAMPAVLPLTTSKSSLSRSASKHGVLGYHSLQTSMSLPLFAKLFASPATTHHKPSSSTSASSAALSRSSSYRSNESQVVFRGPSSESPLSKYGGSPTSERSGVGAQLARTATAASSSRSSPTPDTSLDDVEKALLELKSLHFDQQRHTTGNKIRITLRYREDVRAMSLPRETTLGSFKDRVKTKFGSASNLSLKYRDPDGVLVSIVDDDDWESALEEGINTGNKLDVQVSDS